MSSDDTMRITQGSKKETVELILRCSNGRENFDEFSTCEAKLKIVKQIGQSVTLSALSNSFCLLLACGGLCSRLDPKIFLYNSVNLSQNSASVNGSSRYLKTLLISSCEIKKNCLALALRDRVILDNVTCLPQ